MSLFSTTRTITGVFSKPQFLSIARSSGPHRLYSTRPPTPNNNAPQNSRSNFKVLPIIALLAISSGSYVLLVKSRTGQNPVSR
ncbi:hypothetical protein N7520_009378 [Penicillium odoratum]|uniref:uncharacterized protein n=1 Tax=Penicillium odoratum TaxID=1167516 RepID=UPI002547209E|nr:uncharacterized protein N7520_009378 [Penicillium odoratum]KAJ5752461.1 hypothetical protein N7520_009378 [Penicillium odoratum]